MKLRGAEERPTEGTAADRDGRGHGGGKTGTHTAILGRPRPNPSAQGSQPKAAGKASAVATRHWGQAWRGLGTMPRASEVAKEPPPPPVPTGCTAPCESPPPALLCSVLLVSPGWAEGGRSRPQGGYGVWWGPHRKALYTGRYQHKKAQGVKMRNHRMDRPKSTPLLVSTRNQARQANRFRNRVTPCTRAEGHSCHRGRAAEAEQVADGAHVAPTRQEGRKAKGTPTHCRSAQPPA